MRDEACRNWLVFGVFLGLQRAPVSEVNDEAMFESSLNPFGALALPGGHDKHSGPMPAPIARRPTPRWLHVQLGRKHHLTVEILMNRGSVIPRETGGDKITGMD